MCIHPQAASTLPWQDDIKAAAVTLQYQFPDLLCNCAHLAETCVAGVSTPAHLQMDSACVTCERLAPHLSCKFQPHPQKYEYMQ